MKNNAATFSPLFPMGVWGAARRLCPDQQSSSTAQWYLVNTSTGLPYGGPVLQQYDFYLQACVCAWAPWGWGWSAVVCMCVRMCACACACAGVNVHTSFGVFNKDSLPLMPSFLLLFAGAGFLCPGSEVCQKHGVCHRAGLPVRLLLQLRCIVTKDPKNAIFCVLCSYALTVSIQ